MKSSKTTRRALLGSFTSLLLCFAMLIGSTFAWFTDTASTSVNKIEAGTLDVELQMKDTQGNWVKAEGKTLDFIKASGASANEAVLWEPGATYELPSIRIVNNGNLALKYEVYLTATGGDLDLAKVLKVNATAGNESLFNGTTPTLETVLNAAKVPDAGETNSYIHGKLGTTANDNATAEIKISMTMDQSADNTYQGMKINGIAVTVVATQDTVEVDSNNNQYDKDATFPAPPTIISSVNDLDTAFTGSGTVVIGQDIAKTTIVSNQNDVAYTITNGQALTVDLASSEFKTTPKLFEVANGGTLTLKGSDGKILLNSNVGGNRFCVLVEEGGTLNIEDGVTIEVQAFPDSIPNVGAIYNAGTVNMNGGKIIVYDTAAIMNMGGTFNMNGGEISLQTAENAAIGHVAYGIAASNAATVNLNAGKISGKGVAYKTYNYGGTTTVVNKSTSFVVNVVDVTNP